MKSLKKLYFFTFVFMLTLNTGCSAQRNVANNDTYNVSSDWKSISLKERKNYITPISKKTSKIDLNESDEYVQINNNIINGNFIFPYNNGYLYSCEKGGGDGPDMIFVYDNGQGKIVEQENIPEQILYVCDNAIYYNEDACIKRDVNGKIEAIVKFQFPEENCLYWAKNYIYYTDTNEDVGKTYVYRVDYYGKQKKKLYEFDTGIDQIYLYKNELWFIFHEFNDIEKSGLGKVNCSSNDVVIYKDIVPEGSSNAGNKISIKNDYVYFNSSGFKRLNIQNNSVEELFHDSVEGMNFVDNCILFYKDNILYGKDSNGVKKLKKLKGKTDGFGGIRVDDNKIFIQSFGGAFYQKICQINNQGKVIKNIND